MILFVIIPKYIIVRNNSQAVVILISNDDINHHFDVKMTINDVSLLPGLLQMITAICINYV